MSPTSSPLWTASRGEQLISCELVVPLEGHTMLRCGYGPQAVIRSQFIASPDAAAVVAEAWKLALVQQGFRVISAVPAA